MEHIVQFAIGIDDAAIVKNVAEHAEKEIITDLKQQVTNQLFQAYYYRQNADPEKDPLSEFSKDIILGSFEEHKDVIIQKAAEILADKLARSKAGKAIFENL